MMFTDNSNIAAVTKIMRLRRAAERRVDEQKETGSETAADTNNIFVL